MTLEDEFKIAVQRTRNLNQRPSNQVLLRLYALYKQVTSGDIPEETFASASDIKTTAKYNAWDSLKGKSKEACMKDYILLVESLD